MATLVKKSMQVNHNIDTTYLNPTDVESWMDDIKQFELDDIILQGEITSCNYWDKVNDCINASASYSTYSECCTFINQYTANVFNFVKRATFQRISFNFFIVSVSYIAG